MKYFCNSYLWHALPGDVKLEIYNAMQKLIDMMILSFHLNGNATSCTLLIQNRPCAKFNCSYLISVTAGDLHTNEIVKRTSVKWVPSKRIVCIPRSSDEDSYLTVVLNDYHFKWDLVKLRKKHFLNNLYLFILYKFISNIFIWKLCQNVARQRVETCIPHHVLLNIGTYK